MNSRQIKRKKNLTTVTFLLLIRLSSMKKCVLFIYCCLVASVCHSQKIISTDIEHFWDAYPKINNTKDTAVQYQLLRTLYLNKASDGLKTLIKNKEYTEQDFMEHFTKYPLFWQSLKSNTQNLPRLYPAIHADLQKLKKAYPSFTSANLFFTIGAFRTNGTTEDRQVLIGSELSLADKSTHIDELPLARQTFYKTQNPLEELALLCTHEYVHTQQQPLTQNLLSKCLYEGIAEFISCKVTGKKSTTPAIAVGKANEAEVVAQYVKDLFIISNDNNWLWGQNNNQLKVRDLGYYIGYEIAERYYNANKNKSAAIKTLIELDYTNETAVELLVDQSKLLPASLEKLYQAYEQQRPTILKISPFNNGSSTVEPGLTSITIYFSEPMVKYNNGIDYGPLGNQAFPEILPNRTFSDDGLSWTFTANLKPNQQYQILISNNFRKADGVRLKPYLIDFTTTQ